MHSYWLGRTAPPQGLDVLRVYSPRGLEADSLVFVDDQLHISWDDLVGQRVYLVSDLPISTPLPEELAGVVPRDRMVLEAIMTLFSEMCESHSIGDRLIRSLNEKELAIQEKQAILIRDSRRYTAIIKYATDLIVVLGPAGRIMFCNDTLRDSLGGANPVGRDFYEYILEEDRGALRTMISRAWREKVPGKREAHVQLSGGKVGVFSLMSNPLIENGQAYGLSIIGRDITDLRSMQQRLSVQALDLTAMINGISHELRNPLMIIGAYMRRITKQGDGVSRYGDALEGMNASIRRIENMVERIERYEQMANMPLMYDVVDLAQLVEEVAVVHSGLRLHLRESQPTRVYTDPDHLHTVVARIVENAAEAGSAEIEAAVNAGEAYVHLSLRDYGPGIDGDPEKIFAPFYSADPSRVGLGLTEARICAVKIGASIKVIPQAEPGAVFIVTLPMDRRHRGRREEY